MMTCLRWHEARDLAQNRPLWKPMSVLHGVLLLELDLRRPYVSK